MNEATYKKNLKNGTVVKPMSIGYAKKQTWYGRVNNWKNMSVTEKDIILCTGVGVSGYMIEMAGDLPGTTDAKRGWTKAWLNDIDKKYTQLVKMARAAGLWLFVSIVNDNMGQGKHGDISPRLAKVLPMAKQLAQIVKKNGTNNVIVQPVAEIQTSAGVEFQKYCQNELKKFTIVYNPNSGYNPKITGWKYKAVHPPKILTTCQKDTLVVSDHSMIIKELAADGKYDGTVNKSKLVLWFNKIFAKCGCRVVAYYAFQRKNHDKNTIKALGDSIKRYQK